MKILFAMIYAPDIGGSGAPIYTDHLMTVLAARGDTPGIVFSVHPDYAPKAALPYHLYPLYMDHPPIFDNQPKAKGSIPFTAMTEEQAQEYTNRFYHEFIRLIHSQRYELIHVQHGMYIGYAAALIKEKYAVPYIISLHAMELNFLHEFPDPILAMRAMVDADTILALSDAQKDRLLSEYTKERIIRLDMQQNDFSRNESEVRYLSQIGDCEIDPARVRVCPLGIDTGQFTIQTYDYTETGLNSLSHIDHPKIVMYAGRLIKMKGILNVLEAEKMYNKNNDVYTIIIGGGEYETLVRQEAAKRTNILYLGFKEHTEMPLYLNYLAEHGGVLTVPSSSEGMSLVYLEAMACGARVIACCKKDMGEMDFMQEPYARFVGFGDNDALATRITEMLTERDISREAIRTRVEKYNLANFQAVMYEMYVSICSQCKQHIPASL